RSHRATRIESLMDAAMGDTACDSNSQALPAQIESVGLTEDVSKIQITAKLRNQRFRNNGRTVLSTPRHTFEELSVPCFAARRTAVEMNGYSLKEVFEACIKSMEETGKGADFHKLWSVVKDFLSERLE
ncbi:MAG: hypothetical protein ABSF48_12340, partial [Thermodesulfobacteriota bacterium]